MKLFYRKMGHGSPLFILHGLFGLSDNWNTVGKVFANSFTVYLIDLRNHGNSPHSGEWTYPAMAGDIVELMNDEKYEKINLLGHSLGGKVAMQFASMHPERVEKLIVADMAPKDYSGKQFGFIEKLLSVNLAEMKSRKEVELELKKIVNDKATVGLLLKNIHWQPCSDAFSVQPEEKAVKQTLTWKFNLKTIAKNQFTIGKTFSIKENIKIPVLFIRGEKSDYLLETDILQIKKYFPDSEMQTLSEAGHWVHADRPLEFAQTVMKFIGK